jgi:hypothetical protein
VNSDIPPRSSLALPKAHNPRVKKKKEKGKREKVKKKKEVRTMRAHCRAPAH